MFTAIATATRRLYEVLDRPMGDVSRERPRGIALIIVLVTIAILSAAVVEFSYATRVNLAIASNQRDKLKSYFLARSAVNLSRLLLAFQFALRDESRETDDEMGRLIARAMRRSNFQIHQYLDLMMKPFTNGKIESPVGGLDLRESGVEGFGDMTGKFEVDVMPEAGRINVNNFFRPELRRQDLTPLCSMVSDVQFDELFSQKSPDGETLTRAVVMGSIIDFIDPDQEKVLLTENCAVKGKGGDETRDYARDDRHDIEPLDARLTHVEALYKVYGVTDAFMETFGENLTVYNVGKPNINVATAPVFYSILCQHVQLASGAGGGGDASSGLDLCMQSPQIGMQVLLFALALDGLRSFFDDPLTVLMAYVGSTESKLLPSAKKGQPGAFLNRGQLFSFIQDFKRDPMLMVQFMSYSPIYQRLAAQNPAFQFDPLNPNFPAWTIQFDRRSLLRSVSVTTPTIYRIKARGIYGTTETEIETVIDIGKTVRRLPDERSLEDRAGDPEELRDLKRVMRDTKQALPKGRILFWRED
jgi:type II secretory pathway component PulK